VELEALLGIKGANLGITQRFLIRIGAPVARPLRGPPRVTVGDGGAELADEVLARWRHVVQLPQALA
jgi:hypothetical protein